jgi:hypothetical protein
VRNKQFSVAGLITIAAAGALIASTPAYAEETIAPTTAVASAPASATVAQHGPAKVGERTVTSDGHRRRHRHRRHRRHHRRHHYRHHRHHRHHRY